MHHATDGKIIQERAIRMMIGNWVRNLLTEKSLSRVELRRHQRAFYRKDLQTHIVDGPSVIKIMLVMVNPQVKANDRDMTDKIRLMSVSQFDGGTTEVIQQMEETCSIILAKGDTHQYHAIDVINALNTAQDKSFYMLWRSHRKNTIVVNTLLLKRSSIKPR